MSQVHYPKSLFLSLVGLLAVTSRAVAGASAVEGFVKDPSGRPIKGADVCIEAKKFSKLAKTDARGHYIFNGLAVGNYKVTLLVNGQVRGSIASIRIHEGKAVQVNFNLTGQMASAKRKTRWVYVHPDIDTHIGGGRWVEIDENGNVVNNATNTGATSNVTRVTGTAVQQLQFRPAVLNPGR